MISKILKWLKDYPYASLEVGRDTVKYISIDKNMNLSNAVQGMCDGMDKNILLNLTEELLGVLILDVEDSIEKKYIRNHLSFELKKKLPKHINFDFDYKKIGIGKYLIEYYKKDVLCEIREKYKLENVIVSSEVIGYYNYWNFYKKNMELRINNLLLISIGKESSYLLFTEKGELNYIRKIRIGQKDIEKNIKKSKLIKEISHTIILQKQNVERVFILGESDIMAKFQMELKDFIEIDTLYLEVEQENLPYISMLGNLYSYHL